MRNLVNWSNYQGTSNPRTEPKNTEPSKTVPGMTLSLRDLLDRYIKGGSVAVFEGQYDAFDVPDNIERMDPMERLELSREIGASLEHHRTKPNKPLPAPQPEPAPQPIPNPPAPSPDPESK